MMEYAGFIRTLDERVKLLIALATGVAAIGCLDWHTEALLLGVSLVTCSICGAVTGVLIFLGTMAGATALIFLIKIVTGTATLPGMGLIFLVLKFGTPCAMMVFVYKTINTSLFLRALARMNVPRSLLIPISVTIRFLPSLVEEYDHIKCAMAFRGMKISLGNLVTRPFLFIEYILMPLLMRSLVIGEELSRSALTRGITTPGKQTCFHEIGLKKKDYLVLGAWSLLILGTLMADHGVPPFNRGGM